MDNQIWPDRLWNKVMEKALEKLEAVEALNSQSDAASRAKEELTRSHPLQLNRLFSKTMVREGTNLRASMLPRTLGRFGEEFTVDRTAETIFKAALRYGELDPKRSRLHIVDRASLGDDPDILGPMKGRGRGYEDRAAICCAMGHPVWFTTAKLQETMGTLSGYGVAVRMHVCNGDGSWWSKLDGSQLMAESCMDAIAHTGLLPDDLEHGASVSFTEVDPELAKEAMNGSPRSLACCMEYPSVDYALMAPKAYERMVDGFRYGGLDKLAQAAADAHTAMWDPTDRAGMGYGDEAR